MSSVGLSERVLGLAAVSLYVFRFFKDYKLTEFILCYMLLGVTAGILIVGMTPLCHLIYMRLTHRVFIFEYNPLRITMALSGSCALICTSIGFARRIVYAHGGPTERFRNSCGNLDLMKWSNTG